MRNKSISGLMMLMGLLAGSGLAADQKTGAGKTRLEAVYHNYRSVCHGDRGTLARGPFRLR